MEKFWRKKDWCKESKLFGVKKYPLILSSVQNVAL